MNNDLKERGFSYVSHSIVFKNSSQKIHFAMILNNPQFRVEIIRAKARRDASIEERKKLQKEIIRSHMNKQPQYELYDYFPLDKLSQLLASQKNKILFAINGSFYIDFGYFRDIDNDESPLYSLGDPIGVLKIHKTSAGQQLANRPIVKINSESRFIFNEKNIDDSQYIITAGPTLFRNGQRITENSIWQEESFTDNNPPLSLTKDLYSYTCARSALIEIETGEFNQQLMAFVTLEGGSNDAQGLTLADFSECIQQVLHEYHLSPINGVYLDGGACSELIGEQGIILSSPSGMSDKSPTGEKYGTERYIAYSIALVKNTV